MPRTNVFLFAEVDGECPVLLWLDGIPDDARDKLFYRIRRLEEAGHELRRPEADFLRDGIYELRVRRQHVNYRLLYFFHKSEAVVAHGCTKKGEVPAIDIERAIERKRRYGQHPERHRYVVPE